MDKISSILLISILTLNFSCIHGPTQLVHLYLQILPIMYVIYL